MTNKKSDRQCFRSANETQSGSLLNQTSRGAPRQLKPTATRNPQRLAPSAVRDDWRRRLANVPILETSLTRPVPTPPAKPARLLRASRAQARVLTHASLRAFAPLTRPCARSRALTRAPRRNPFQPSATRSARVLITRVLRVLDALTRVDNPFATRNSATRNLVAAYGRTPRALGRIRGVHYGGNIPPPQYQAVSGVRKIYIVHC